MRAYRSEDNRHLQRKSMTDTNPLHEERMNSYKKLFQTAEKKKLPKKP